MDSFAKIKVGLVCNLLHATMEVREVAALGHSVLLLHFSSHLCSRNESS